MFRFIVMNIMHASATYLICCSFFFWRKYFFLTSWRSRARRSISYLYSLTCDSYMFSSDAIDCKIWNHAINFRQQSDIREYLTAINIIQWTGIHNSLRRFQCWHKVSIWGDLQADSRHSETIFLFCGGPLVSVYCYLITELPAVSNIPHFCY